MAVDLPPGLRVPGQAERELLEMFVVQAGLALSNAQQRERLARQVHLGEIVKEVAQAGSRVGLEAMLDRRDGGDQPRLRRRPDLGELRARRRRRDRRRRSPTRPCEAHPPTCEPLRADLAVDRLADRHCWSPVAVSDTAGHPAPHQPGGRPGVTA